MRNRRTGRFTFFNKQPPNPNLCGATVVHHIRILAFFRSKIRSESDGIVEVMSSILIGSTK